MKKNLFSINVITQLLILSAIFIAALFVPIDPDLGWHLKYGEHFFENGGILRDNNFSALMPDYKWNNSSWATDLISYQTFNNFGFLGLSILGAFVITLTFFFIGKAAKLSIFEKSIIFPIVLYFVSPVNQVSFRGQLLSLLFIAVMFYILSKFEERNKRGLFLLIPLFIAWSNFHGEFILGLALFFIWIFVYSVKEIYLNYRNNVKKFFFDNKFLLVTFFGSIPATLINPYGIGIYFETIKHFGDPMQKAVAEWLSPTDFSTVWWHQLFIGMVITIGLVMLGLGKKTLDKAPFYVPTFILFILTFGVRRYAWPFYYSSFFLLAPVVKYFEPDNKRHSLIVSCIFTILFLIFAISTKYPFEDLKKMNWNNYCKKSVGCSPTAAKAVIDNKLNNDKLLTIYDYGGWLNWNYPQITLTIDGRMHLWRNEEGYSAFEYYYPIEQNTTADIDSSDYNAVLTSKRKPIFNRLMELRDEGKWEAIHIDKYSAVFVRK